MTHPLILLGAAALVMVGPEYFIGLCVAKATYDTLTGILNLTDA